MSVLRPQPIAEQEKEARAWREAGKEGEVAFRSFSFVCLLIGCWPLRKCLKTIAGTSGIMHDSAVAVWDSNQRREESAIVSVMETL
jgi:hypothetical protein